MLDDLRGKAIFHGHGGPAIDPEKLFRLVAAFSEVAARMPWSAEIWTSTR